MRLPRQLLDGVRPGTTITNEPMVFVCGLSRSGTTLLATALDAHPRIAMGYELLPPPIPDMANALDTFERTLQLTNGDLRQSVRVLRGPHPAAEKLGQWFMRCHRAGLDAGEIRDALRIGATSGRQSRCETFRERLSLATSAIDHVRRRTGALLAGFKLPGNRFHSYHKAFPAARFVGIIRDPRDTYLSQRRHEFVAGAGQFAGRWNAKVRALEEVTRAHPGSAVLLRYEDLVRDPESVLQRVFAMLDVDLTDDVLRFHESDATVFDSPHPETAHLRRGFTTDRIAGWRSLLGDDEAYTIRRRCRRAMSRLDYLDGDRVSPDATGPAESTLALHGKLTRQLAFRWKRRHSSAAYFTLLQPFLENHETMTMADYVRVDDVGDRQIALLRHDVDEDLDNALRMARWENERGLRATYFLRHSAWYYGRLIEDRILHTRELAGAIRQLTALGHEVGLHNDLLRIALQKHLDPYALLSRELDYFASLGVEVRGTAAHGHPFCHDNGFSNWEIFAESCGTRFGGPRTISLEVDGHRAEVAVGERSMADFGLEYEAYEIGRDVYITDVGGTIRTERGGRGTREFGRLDRDRGHVVIALTHPIWWKFPGDG